MNRSGKIGVSPAFFISRYGTGFTLDNIIQSCRDISALGFDSLQLEVFEPEALSSWTGEKRELLKKEMGALNLVPSQFVAHYMMGWISEFDPDYEGDITESFDPFLMSFMDFENCDLLTLPVGPFVSGKLVTPSYQERWEQMVQKLTLLGKRVEAAGGTLCLEIIPGSLLQGSDGLMRLRQEKGLENLGLNLDTGHHNVIGEPLSLIPGKLGQALKGTHLCDNDGKHNSSNPPGEGTVDWQAVITSLLKSDYSGSMDLEIVCPPEEVLQVYGNSRMDFLKRLEQAESALSIKI